MDVPGEARCGVASESCHEASRVGPRPLLEKLVDVGALVEEKRERGLPLEIDYCGSCANRGAPLKRLGQRGCTGGRKARHGLLPEDAPLGAPVADG